MKKLNNFFFSQVNFNVWFWSAVVQSSNKELVETVNYSCNFVTVLTLMYCLLLR